MLTFVMRTKKEKRKKTYKKKAHNSTVVKSLHFIKFQNRFNFAVNLLNLQMQFVI